MNFQSFKFNSNHRQITNNLQLSLRLNSIIKIHNKIRYNLCVNYLFYVRRVYLVTLTSEYELKYLFDIYSY